MRILSIFAVLAAFLFAAPAFTSSAFAGGPLSGNSGLVIPGIDIGADLGLGGGLGGSEVLTGAYSIGDASDNGLTVGVGEAGGLAESSLRIDGGGLSGHVLIDTDARAYSGAQVNGPGYAVNTSGAGSVAGTGVIGGGVSIGW